VSQEFTPEDIPLYEDQRAREREYETAQREGKPYLGVERYEEGYAITYDLLPADAELVSTTQRELTERVNQTAEDIVADEVLPTEEVSKSISASLGNIGFFVREQSARDVAVVVAQLVLDDDNWTTPTDTGGPSTGSLRRN
jgi:hypothetical protein